MGAPLSPRVSIVITELAAKVRRWLQPSTSALSPLPAASPGQGLVQGLPAWSVSPIPASCHSCPGRGLAHRDISPSRSRGV